MSDEDAASSLRRAIQLLARGGPARDVEGGRGAALGLASQAMSALGSSAADAGEGWAVASMSSSDWGTPHRLGGGAAPALAGTLLGDDVAAADEAAAEASRLRHRVAELEAELLAERRRADRLGAEADERVREAEERARREASAEADGRVREAEERARREASAEADGRVREAEERARREASAEADGRVREAEARARREASAEADGRVREAEERSAARLERAQAESARSLDEALRSTRRAARARGERYEAKLGALRRQLRGEGPAD